MATSDDTAEKGSDDTPAENPNDKEDKEVSENDNDKEDFAKATSEVPTKPTPDAEALEDINSLEQGNLLKGIENKTFRR